MKANTINIPARADTAVLLKHRVGNEPLVILNIPDVGNTGSFDLRGRDGKTLVLKWDSKRNGHIVKIPVTLWQQSGNAMAKNVLDQRRSGHSFIVTFEEYQSPEMGAVVVKPVDTVVGSTVADAAAPASDGPPDGVVGESLPVEFKDNDYEAVKPATEEVMPLHTIVATYIQRNGSSRMRQVEADLEVPASEIRASLELPDSPVELSGGWVKFKD